MTANISWNITNARGGTACRVHGHRLLRAGARISGDADEPADQLFDSPTNSVPPTRPPNASLPNAS